MATFKDVDLSQIGIRGASGRGMAYASTVQEFMDSGRDVGELDQSGEKNKFNTLLTGIKAYLKGHSTVPVVVASYTNRADKSKHLILVRSDTEAGQAALAEIRKPAAAPEAPGEPVESDEEGWKKLDEATAPAPA